MAAVVAGAAPSILLGELIARVAGSVRSGERYVVLGWALGGEGRKRLAAVAILGEDGTPRAVACAIWITIAWS